MRCAISPLPTMQRSRQSLLKSSGSTGTSTCTASAPRCPWGETNSAKRVTAVANKVPVAGEAITPSPPPPSPGLTPSISTRAVPVRPPPSCWWSWTTWTLQSLRWAWSGSFFTLTAEVFWATPDSPFTLQFPQELVTYGGNGQVFSNWAQVRPCVPPPALRGRVWIQNNCVCVGAVPPGDALPEPDERGTDAGHVQRPPHGPVPQSAGLTSRHPHQRHGNAPACFILLHLPVCCKAPLPSPPPHPMSLRSSLITPPELSMRRCLPSESPCGWEWDGKVRRRECSDHLCSSVCPSVRYGQMTAGSYCYIGPQGIVHGTMVREEKRWEADAPALPSVSVPVVRPESEGF